MADLVKFAQDQNAPEADNLNHWDISFWSERLRESKYEINEVLSNVLSVVSVLLKIYTQKRIPACKSQMWS